MDSYTLFRQEYVRLLWVHHKQTSSESSKIQQERQALKNLQRVRLAAAASGLHFIKRLFITFNNMAEMQRFNQMAELRLDTLRQEQQKELSKLKKGGFTIEALCKSVA